MVLLFDRVGLFFKVLGLGAISLPPVLAKALYKVPWAVIKFLALHSWDLGLFLGNVLTPQLKKGTVVKPGKDGYDRNWPTFVKPTSTDSRSPCPYLNAMANHGILPHDGKNILLADLGKAMVDSFNFSPSLVKDTINSVQSLYGHPDKRINLSDLSAHNVVEHDASLIRHDAIWQKDQTTPAFDLIKDMLESATGPVTDDHPEGKLTPSDLSRCLSLRKARSKRDNPTFQLDALHAFFGASNASLMYEVVDGDVRALRTILLEERFPKDWESSMRGRFGYTMKEFHMRSAEIYLGMKDIKLPEDDISSEEAYRRGQEAAANAAAQQA